MTTRMDDAEFARLADPHSQPHGIEERARLLAEAKRARENEAWLAGVLHRIGYEPFGHAEATDSEILEDIETLARETCEALAVAGVTR